MTEAHGLPTSRRPGMREVADRAGVAMSSVSRVLSGHPDVSSRMRDIVMEAVRELGYQPDLLAQGLRSGRTFSVGFTVSDILNPVLAAAVTGAEKRLREAGYSLLLTNSEGNASLDVEHIALLERRRVDGLILSLADERHPETIASLRRVAIPMVLMDRDVPPGVSAGSAAFNHGMGMASATKHLLSLGHRNFALITGGPERPARERRSAIENVLKASSHDDARLAVYPGEFTTEHGKRAMLEIAMSTPRPSAVIAGGNVLMQGALLALRTFNIALGRDISFIGCDDTGLAELHAPQVAVVRRDMSAIGSVAAELLLDQMEAREGVALPQQEIILPTEFIARPSCGPFKDPATLTT